MARSRSKNGRPVQPRAESGIRGTRLRLGGHVWAGGWAGDVLVGQCPGLHRTVTGYLARCRVARRREREFCRLRPGYGFAPGIYRGHGCTFGLGMPSSAWSVQVPYHIVAIGCLEGTMTTARRPITLRRGSCHDFGQTQSVMRETTFSVNMRDMDIIGPPMAMAVDRRDCHDKTSAD